MQGSITRIWKASKVNLTSMGRVQKRQRGLASELQNLGTSLVVQWLRICLAVQGMWIQSLAWALGFHTKESEVAQLCLTVTPWTAAHQASVHGISHAEILEWVAISFYWGSS